MKLKERLSRDREILKRLEGKSKGRFLWDYYRIPIVVIASLILLGALAVMSAAGHSHCVLYAVFVNADRTDTAHDPAALEALLENGGVEMRGKRVDLRGDLALGGELNAGDDGQTLQMLTALFMISDLDFFAADPASFALYAGQDAFADLSVLIEPELWSNRSETDLIWHENSDGYRSLQGVVLHGASPLHTAGYFRGDVTIGATANGENLDAAVVLIREILRAG